MKTFLKGVVALFAVSAAPWAYAQKPPEPLKIGALVGLSGPSAVTGLGVVAGMQAAVRELNQKGGILGRTLELVQADDAGDPTRGVSEARRLSQVEGVKFLFGSASSAVTIATLPVFTEAKVLQFSSTGSSEASPEKGPYHFNPVSTDANAIAQSFVDYVTNVAKAKRVAVLSDSSPLYKAVREGVQERAKGRFELSGIQEYEPRTTDLAPQLLSLRRGSPDMLWVIGILPTDAATAMKGMKEIGWTVPLATGLSGGLQAKALLAVLPADQIPAHVGQVYTSYSYCTGAPLGQSALPKAIETLRAAVPDYDKYISITVLNGYDSVMMANQIYTGAGTTDTVAAAAWLEANSDKVKSIVHSLGKPGKSSHFLVAPDSLAFAENPWAARPDGLVKRAGC